MTIRNLEIFTKVAELGTMSAAAKELYITQPSVSLAIAEIEREYEVKLFDRAGRRLSLTPAGKQLMGYAAGIIHLNDEMELFLKNESHNPGIRVGATATVGLCVVAPVIARLREEMPGVACEVTVANTGIIEEKLLRSELDIGLVEGDVTAQDLVVKPIMDDELAVVCSMKHRFAGRATVNITELEGEELILREVGSGTRAKVETILREKRVAYDPRWSCYSFEAIKEALMHDLGITVVSPKVVARELQRGELWSCAIEGADLKRTFDIVYRKNKFFSSALTRFTKLCENIEQQKTPPS